MKRLEAEERNRLSRRLKPLKNELASVEARIAGLEEVKKNHEKELCLPGMHEKPDRIRLLTQELQKVHQELEDLYDRWADITERIEGVQS